jgi:hypothetical protein
MKPFVGLYGGCYYFHTQPTTFTKSVDICWEKGAILAQIDSAGEEHALTQYIEGKHIMSTASKYNKVKVNLIAILLFYTF